MNTLKTLLIGASALVAFALPNAAQADDSHRRHSDSHHRSWSRHDDQRRRVIVYRSAPYYRHSYYSRPAYGYYDPYYDPYYYRPYYGPTLSFAFGGHGFYHRGPVFHHHHR